MKIPNDLLDSMQTAVKPQSRWEPQDLLRQFIYDESGRGITGYGLIFALLMLMAGIGYGIFVVNRPAAFGCCGGCGMG